jgi:hypothetical protein
MALWLGACVVGVVVCGCSDDERVVKTNAGRVCLFASEPDSPPDMHAPQDYQAGQRLYVVIEVVGGACDENRVFTCTASLSGSTLTVTSEYAFDQSDETCTDMGALQTTTCTTDPLPAGDYTVVYGAADFPLTIPSTRTGACLN